MPESAKNAKDADTPRETAGQAVDPSRSAPDPAVLTTQKTARGRAVYWVVSLAITAVLLFFSLRGIAWRRVWSILLSANLLYFLAAYAMMSCALFLRAFRWRVILLAEGAVSISLAFWATAAGYLGNNVLPARAGEVIRSLMVSSRTGLGKAFVLTTALSERVVDAIAVITISSVVLLTMRQRPGWLAVAARPFAVLGFFGVTAIVLIPTFEVFWFRFLGLLPMPARLREQVEGILRQGLQGIRSFHDLGRLMRFVTLTAIVWCSDAFTSVVLASSIGVGVTLSMAFLLTAGLALGSALPSTPGYVGIYQFAAISVLTPFGLSRDDAIAYILLFQALNYAVVFSWGGLGFLLARRAITT
jgi:glycosyltransferase 2 family protein